MLWDSDCRKVPRHDFVVGTEPTSLFSPYCPVPGERVRLYLPALAISPADISEPEWAPIGTAVIGELRGVPLTSVSGVGVKTVKSELNVPSADATLGVAPGKGCPSL